MDTNFNPANPSPQQPVATAPAPAPAQPLAPLPETWPGAFGIYKYSRDAVRLNFVPLLVLFLITYLVGGLAEFKLGIIGSIISILISTYTGVSIVILYIAGVQRHRLGVMETISKSAPLFLKMLGLQLLISVTILASLLLLIIPFFFVLPRLVLAEYYLIGQNMGIVESYKASWAATKGNVGKVWGILGASLAMGLLFITIIGIPFAIYFLIMYSAAYAVLYGFLIKQSPAAPAGASPASAPVPSAVPPVQAAAGSPPSVNEAGPVSPTAAPQANPEPADPTTPPINPAPPNLVQ